MLHATLLPSLLLLPTSPLAPAAPGLGLEPIAPLSFAPTGMPRQEDEPTFQYSYLEVGATRFDAENFDDEADTYYGEVSFDIFHLVNVFLGYENLSTDFQNLDTDVFRLGAGAHFAVTEFLDLTGDVAWLYSKLDSDTLDEDSNGTQLRVGGRWMVLRTDALGLEVFGRGVSVNIDDSFYSDDSATGFDAGLRVHLGAFSVAGQYSKIEDDDSVGLALRLSF